MQGPTQAVFRWLGFDTPIPRLLPPWPGPRQDRLFRFLRIVFGLIWLYDAWNASSAAGKTALAAFLGLPMSSWLVHLAGTGVVLVDLYIAVALLSGRGMRLALWLGVAGLLSMWIGVEHGGGFNPAAGATDAGIAPPYLILLVLTWACWRLGAADRERPSGRIVQRDRARLWISAARVMFGFLWAWDALLKLEPHFLTHFVGFLGAAQQGQPGWVTAYLQLWIDLITHTSPLLFGVLAALAESAIAWSLLSGRMLRVFLPLGVGYSFMVWSTAEAFGGPYGIGQTGMPGNMFGNAVIYMLVFAGLMVAYRWPARVVARKPVGAEDPGEAASQRWARTAHETAASAGEMPRRRYGNRRR